MKDQFNIGDIIRSIGMTDGEYSYGVVIAIDGFYEEFDLAVKIEWLGLNRIGYMPATHIVKVEEV
jgi:hypothetical protein